MQRKMDRRTFLVRSAAATGGVAASLGVFPALAGSDFVHGDLQGLPPITWYALDPVWGAGLPGCPIDPVDASAASHACHACNSCHKHGMYKLFPNAVAADDNRAHVGCKCTVVEGGQLPADTWMALFGPPNNVEREQVDRRWDWVQEVLGEECDLEFAHSAFEQTWAYTDKPVQDGNIARSWIWSPLPYTCGMTEDYVEGKLADGTTGKRLVQYFDKSRMEIIDPAGDASSIWFVTNGLLVVELVTGQMQVGHNTFVQRQPAAVNAAGDADDPDGPMYASYGSVLNAQPLSVGSVITQTIDRDGNVGNDLTMAVHNVMAGHFDEVTNHTVAQPFWDFMNSSGPVYQNGIIVVGNLFVDALFGTGRPISEAYWAMVKVADTVQPVLTQCFERRVMTYTPLNDPNWRVEAGNVGQHYYTWRYG